MPEPQTTDTGGISGKEDGGKVSYITLDDDTDTGDSEFEPPGGGGTHDDDSIAADEDVADEEEVNGLMRVRAHRLSSSLVNINLTLSLFYFFIVLGE